VTIWRRQARHLRVPPSQLSPQEQDAKIRTLDAFWDRVKARGPEDSSASRDDHRRYVDGYFAFTAASLLASLDRSPSSLSVVELGLARADLDEIDVAAYVRMVVGMIHARRDVEKLAQKYLRHPKVDTRIAQHGGMLLDRDGGGSSSTAASLGHGRPVSGDRPALAGALRPSDGGQVARLSLSEPALKALKAYPLTSLKPTNGSSSSISSSAGRAGLGVGNEVAAGRARRAT